MEDHNLHKCIQPVFFLNTVWTELKLPVPSDLQFNTIQTTDRLKGRPRGAARATVITNICLISNLDVKTNICDSVVDLTWS